MPLSHSRGVVTEDSLGAYCLGDFLQYADCKGGICLFMYVCILVLKMSTCSFVGLSATQQQAS